jgi:hypothetical protein
VRKRCLVRLSKLAIVLLLLTSSVPDALSQYFESRATLSVGAAARNATVLADFNGDGHLDLATMGNLSLIVAIGKGDGTFQNPVAYSAKNAYWMASGDFNGDGRPDLVVTAGVDGVGVLLGNADGTFLPAIYSTSGGAPTFVAVGDFNGDHLLDVVTVQTPNLAILLGKGDGTFETPIILTPPIVPFELAVDLFDGDDHVDLAVCGQLAFGKNIAILLGNGDGSFREGDVYPVGEADAAVSAADLNNDGILDLVVAAASGTNTNVFLGNGDGTFRPMPSYPTYGPEWVAVADVGGDGRPDLVTADIGNPSGVSVYRGNGNGTFQHPMYYPGGHTTFFVAVGDLNGDGKPDLVVPDAVSGDVFVLLNTGVLRFVPSSPLRYAAQIVGTQSAPQSLNLTNTGKRNLTIFSMTATTSFEANSRCGSSIPPGVTCTIDVAFAPSTKGRTSGFLSIVDSASSSSQVIELFGTGTVVSLNPSQLSFPPTPVGSESEPESVTMMNTGPTKIKISGINVVGDFSRTTTCASELGPCATCDVSVTFKPSRTGTRTGTLYVNDSGGGVTQKVSLSGTGT